MCEKTYKNIKKFFCQPCAEKGIELAGKVYRLCFDSNCPKGNGKKRIYLTKSKPTN